MAKRHFVRAERKQAPRCRIAQANRLHWHCCRASVPSSNAAVPRAPDLRHRKHRQQQTLGALEQCDAEQLPTPLTARCVPANREACASTGSHRDHLRPRLRLALHVEAGGTPVADKSVRPWRDRSQCEPEPRLPTRHGSA